MTPSLMTIYFLCSFNLVLCHRKRWKMSSCVWPMKLLISLLVHWFDVYMDFAGDGRLFGGHLARWGSFRLDNCIVVVFWIFLFRSNMDMFQAITFDYYSILQTFNFPVSPFMGFSKSSYLGSDQLIKHL